MTDQTPSHPTPAWAALAAAPATPTSMTALAAVDATTLTGAQLVDATICAEKTISLLTGVQARLLAALAVPFVAGDPMRLAAALARRSRLAGGSDNDDNVHLMVPEAAQSLAAADIAAALRIAPVTAGIRVREAVHLTEEFTPARQALEHGTLDRGKLRAIIEQVQVLPADHLGPVLHQVLSATTDRCTSEIREIAAQAVITADPDGAADRHQQAAARRDLTITPTVDAMATLKAFLPADGAVKIFQVSDLLATSTGGLPQDHRGIGARRADALIDLADRLLTDGHIDLTGYLGQPLPDPTHQRRRPHHPTPDPAGHPATDPDTCTPANSTLTGTVAATADRSAVQTPTEPLICDPASSPVTAPMPTEPVVNEPVVTDLVDAEPVVTDPAAPPGTNPVNPVTGRTNGPVLTRQGRRPHLTVTLSLDTLAGLNDLPAVLAGFGSIPADLARSIAASAGTITAALIDPTTGTITTAGDLTYRPTQALRDQVTALTDTCRFPSCRQPTWRCDLDHRTPFDHRHPDRGGPTNQTNCGGLCRRHHLFKTFAGWGMTVDTHRMIVNRTSPTGHTYTRRPRPAGPPDTWIRTTATTLAEHLDHLATISGVDHPTDPTHPTNATTPAAPDPAGPNLTHPATTSATDPNTITPAAQTRAYTSDIEDRLTDLLLVHALTNPRIVEYDHDATDQSTGQPAHTTEHLPAWEDVDASPTGDDDDLDDELDEPPPF